jgi:ADP-ribose pyrophosphatase YjhB (NUDIX family)
MGDRDKKIWIVSGVAVEHKGKFLITQQAQGMFHEGKWAVPGGVLDSKMTILGNAKKEILEETGLEVEITGLLGILRKDLKPKEPTDPEGLVIYFLYHGKAKTHKVKIKKGEISGFKWLALKELKDFPKDDFRPIMDWVIQALERRREFPIDVVSEEKTF